LTYLSLSLHDKLNHPYVRVGEERYVGDGLVGGGAFVWKINKQESGE